MIAGPVPIRVVKGVQINIDESDMGTAWTSVDDFYTTADLSIYRQEISNPTQVVKFVAQRCEYCGQPIHKCGCGRY